MEKINNLFIVSLILSGILHIIFIAGISDISGFDFFIPLSEKIFLAKLVTEEPRVPALKARATNPVSSKAVNPPEDKDNSIKEEPSADNDGKHENSEPVQDNTVAVNNNETPHPDNQETANAQDKPLPETKTDTAAPDSAEVKSEAATDSKANALIKTLREKLSYDIYWLNIFVGRAVLEATNDKGTVKITSQVHSSSFISNFYKVEDYAESIIINGLPSHFKIKQREGKYRSDKETVFDLTNKKITFMNYLKGTRDEHSMAGPVLWDVISGFYHLRTLLFEVGKTVYIDIFDSNKFFKAEVNVLGKEKIALADKSEINTILVKPTLKSEGLFQNKGEILIWLTDDESKIPVRIETKVPIGTVVAELKSLETEK